jgi:hypothetical protein
VDARTVSARLRAEGIDCTVHRDGTLTAALMKPREQTWTLWLKDRVKALPGAVVTLTRERPASDPWLIHTEERFVLGPYSEARG